MTRNSENALPPPAGMRETEIVQFDRDHPNGQKRSDAVIVERPLSIEVDNTTYTILRTPGADRELVAGFLFTEGLIVTPDDIQMLRECPDSPDAIAVKTRDAGDKPRRSLTITSSCGLCGREDMRTMVAALGRVAGALSVPLAVLYRVPAALRGSQPLFDLTGGAHAAALFDASGNVLCVKEDVGRHNALDKLIGHALLRKIAMSELGLFLSGRTSLEMIAKAARARIPLVAAVGAPTTAALEAADQLGITLCGFLRDQRISVYSHRWRIAEKKS